MVSCRLVIFIVRSFGRTMQDSIRKEARHAARGCVLSRQLYRQTRRLMAALCAGIAFCIFTVPAAAAEGSADELSEPCVEERSKEDHAWELDISGAGPESGVPYDAADPDYGLHEDEVQRQESSARLTRADMPLYFGTPVDRVTIEVTYLDGNTDIPYLSANVMFQIMERTLGLQGITFHSLHCRNGTMSATQRDGSCITVDFNDGVVICRDLSGFFRPGYAEAVPDLLSASGISEKNDVQYFDRVSGSFERRGRDVVINLSEREIPMLWQNNTGYLPMQTFSDIFLECAGAALIYNGQMAAVVYDGELGDLEDMYYAAEPCGRSQELADYTYNELCLALDLFYGLKPEHNIGSFDSLFRLAGLEPELRSQDPMRAGNALTSITEGYLGDVVSRVKAPSFRAGQGAKFVPETESPSYVQYTGSLSAFREAAARAYPAGIPGYEEIGDTAYITVSSFDVPAVSDYYSAPPNDVPADVIGLVAYAHERITRENSPIRSVVVDMSAADGENMDGAIYLLGWLNGTAAININDTLTGAQSTVRYRSDVDLDGAADANDSIQHLNRVILISPATFSAGSALAASIAGTDVHIVGQPTSAGACQSMPISMADGTIIRIFGHLRISSLMNGSYYSVNEGIEPQFRLVCPGDFYDRKRLAEYISALY